MKRSMLVGSLMTITVLAVASQSLDYKSYYNSTPYAQSIPADSKPLQSPSNNSSCSSTPSFIACSRSRDLSVSLDSPRAAVNSGEPLSGLATIGYGSLGLIMIGIMCYGGYYGGYKVVSYLQEKIDAIRSKYTIDFSGGMREKESSVKGSR